MKLKGVFLVLLAVFSFAHLAEAQLIFAEDYSVSSIAGWRRSTVAYGEFHDAWSMTSSLPNDGGNRYGLFDINIPTSPTDSGARWYAGGSFNLSASPALPGEWELSFRIYMDTVEPIKILFDFPRTAPLEYPTLTAWVTPSQTGWSTVTIDSGSFVPALAFGSGFFGTYMSISMASHDAAGNPLSISNVGTYSFRLDDVTLTAVPEPGSIAFVLFGLAAMGAMRSRRRALRPQS